MVFDRKSGFEDMRIDLPCGQCIGCRLERSRQWAVRCMHEAQMHEDNAFLTLTYSDGWLPPGGTLVKKDFQDFMKRYRDYLSPRRISFYHCGEYGEQTFRPHYHALIFGHDFKDKKVYSKERDDYIYTSETLDSLWKMGECKIGAVTFESAAYVARYVMKKVTGEQAKNHYFGVDKDTGECYDLLPEYATMSRNPAIGKRWLEKYQDDVYPRDEVIVRGHITRPPRYYDTQYEKSQGTILGRIKGSRKASAAAHADDQTIARLRTREKVKKAQISQLKRTL